MREVTLVGSANGSIKINVSLMVVVMLSMISFILIALDFNRPSYYGWLPFLPLMFCLVNILFMRIYRAIPTNIGMSMIVMLYFFRLVFIPAFMSLGNYHSVLKLGIETNAPKAISLMIYELVVVYLIMYLSLLRYNSRVISKFEEKKDYRGNTRVFIIVMSILCIFDLYVWLFISDSHAIYKSVFRMHDTDFTTNTFNISTQFSSGSLKRAILTLFTMTVEFVRIFVSAYFIIAIKKRYHQSIKGILLSIPFAVIQLLFVSATISQSVICAFLLLLFIAKLYPEKNKIIYTISLLSVVSFVAVYYAIRFNVSTNRYGNNPFEYMSGVFTAYFSSVDNVAAIFNISDTGKWESLFFNLYYSIPFNGTLFGLKGNNLANLYNSANFSYGQIPPSIGAGYYYFGPILSPIFVSIMATLSIHYGFKTIHQNDLWKYLTYTLLSIMMAIGLIMYNETIVLSWFTNLILPMLILSRLTKNTNFSIKTLDGKL
jgi:hypothetical protein